MGSYVDFRKCVCPSNTHAGILFLSPDRPVVLAACAKGFWDLRLAERLFSQVGQKTYDLLKNPKLGEEVNPPELLSAPPPVGGDSAPACAGD